MSCLITSGRNEICKDNISGIKRIYLSNYRGYLRKDKYTTNGNTLTYFNDGATLYEIQFGNTGNSFKETFGNDRYTQSINISLPKLDIPTNKLMEQLLNIETRVIIETNNGLIKIFGLKNGLNVNSIQLTTAGTKNGFNGYTFSFEGIEDAEAMYIDNLENAGFIIDSKTLYEFQDFTPFLFQDNKVYKFN